MTDYVPLPPFSVAEQILADRRRNVIQKRKGSLSESNTVPEPFTEEIPMLPMGRQVDRAMIYAKQNAGFNDLLVFDVTWLDGSISTFYANVYEATVEDIEKGDLSKWGPNWRVEE